MTQQKISSDVHDEEISEDTSRDYKMPAYISLQVPFPEEGTSMVEWKRKLENLLQHFFKFPLRAELTHRGYRISTLRDFNNRGCEFFFRQKEIPEWFRIQTCGPSIIVDLPPDLHHNNDWMGIVTCHSFFDHNRSDLKTSADIASMFYFPDHGVTTELHNKWVIQWKHGDYFIIINFTPRSIFGDSLKEARCMKFETDCPDLQLRRYGIRLLYQQDLAELKKELIKCFVSHLDHKDSIDQFLETIS